MGREIACLGADQVALCLDGFDKTVEQFDHIGADFPVLRRFLDNLLDVAFDAACRVEDVVEENALQHCQPFRLAKIRKGEEHEGFAANGKWRGRHLKIERRVAGGCMNQNAAFANHLLFALLALENGVDGAAGGAVSRRAAPIRPFFCADALDRLSWSLRKHFVDRRAKCIE